MARSIFIVGCPASGKSTFGRALARSLGREFIDLDRYIENRFHSSIPDIFTQKGEAAFREMENKMLREAGEFENVVIACGGGTPCHGENMKWMLCHGHVIWLEASLQKVVSRLMLNSRRPMFKGLNKDDAEAKLRSLLREREQYYSLAHIRFSGEKLENREEIASTVMRFHNQHPDI